ncbi:PHP domain-containing protein [Pseudoramibacter alactolyticus]
MKAVDLHIHTVATISDSKFDFSMEELKNYVEKMGLDIIAITNHNIFDLEQYRYIRDNLNIKVFPGIEINFENGHLLLISDDKNLEEFKCKCDHVNEKICDPKDSITKDELLEIFENIDEYLLIPHYPKKPKVAINVIKSFSNDISAIEVGSIKDFLREYKENKEYTPVWFSDMRACKNNDKCKYGRVYFNIDDDDITSIKIALRDREKIKLSYTESNSLFPIDDNGFQISTGLNVILGARSSGKSHFLDTIEKNNLNVKYLKQFSLLDKKEEESKEFSIRLSNENSLEDEKLFEEFKEVINDVMDISILQEDKEIEDYIKSLIKFATEEERRDNYSRARLYTESLLKEKPSNSVDELLKSVETIMNNKEYSSTISKYIDVKQFKGLIIELAKIAIQNQKENILKRKANQIITTVKDKLQIKSTSNKINEVNFRKHIENKDKIDKFNKICQLVKKERQLELEKTGKFKLVMNTGPYKRVGEIKDRVKTKDALSNAFQKYTIGYDYLQELKKIEGIAKTDYYKYYVNTKFDVVNNYNLSASDGERAEYNLLNEIKSSLEYDLLLIDEPESSFDNPFLKEEVNELIKDIAKKMPVILVTHNNTVGLSIKPDYILYTERSFDDEKGEVTFNIFKGTPDSQFLISEDGKRILTKDVLMNSLEAGESAYNNRRDIYELHENRK